ncbi:RNA polymerase sigma factor RpoD/SigA [bacterium]|nr:RNA polymerase sigma factor RpoD/SigA [bacterium]
MIKTSFKSNPADNNVIPQSTNAFDEYVQKLSKIPYLSAEEEREIAKLAYEGDEEAKQKLIEANLKLVITIAKKTVHMSNLPFIDLVQEGNLGLMVAVEKFNYKLGYKFATYATWWIKQAIFKAISEQSYCIKVPVYVQETLSKFSKVKAELERKNNCQVRNEEVAKEMNIGLDKIDRYLGAFSKSISLESEYQLNNGSEVSFSEILVDEKANTEAVVEQNALKEDLICMISQLKERERDVVKLRYGFIDGDKKTLEEIGNIWGVTKECIRQTELRALRKLKALALNANMVMA